MLVNTAHNILFTYAAQMPTQKRFNLQISRITCRPYEGRTNNLKIHISNVICNVHKYICRYSAFIIYLNIINNYKNCSLCFIISPVFKVLQIHFLDLANLEPNG